MNLAKNIELCEEYCLVSFAQREPLESAATIATQQLGCYDWDLSEATLHHVAASATAVIAIAFKRVFALLNPQPAF